MNKYSLQFNSREFEFAFFQNEKKHTRVALKIATIVNIIQSIVLITYYFVDDQAQPIDRIIAIAFFSIGVISWCIKILMKRHQKISTFVLFGKNCTICFIIGIYQLVTNQDYLHQYLNYQPLLGVLLTIEILTSIQGTNFLYKILLCGVNLVLFGFAFYSEKSTCLIISMSFGILYYLSYVYLSDKQKRDIFLDKQKSIELSFLIDKLLPINIVVMKYNPKEERSFLHQVNRKAQNTFNISDNDAFKEFSKRVIVKQEAKEDDLDESDENLNGNQPQTDTDKTLFFYLESIAKENYMRQNKEKNKTTDKIQSAQKSERNSRLVTRTDRVGSISKAQRNKINSLFERPQKLSDDIKYNDRVNSGERDRMQRYSLFEPSKVSSIDRNKNNSIDRPKMVSIERPKNISIERTIVGSIEKASHHSGDKNRAKNSSMEKEKSRQNLDERSKKISFEKDRANNTPVHVRSSKRSSTVKIDNTTGNAASGGQIAGKFVRRVQKKGTIMRKVSNFNLKSGVANSKVKYGEDVYDRIDIFTGVYTEKDGSQRYIQIKIYTYNVNEQYQVILIEDETLEGQVKYLRELNKFLYKSFQESLEQFRMPLAYSLLKLNDTYEQAKAEKEERQSPTSCTNLNQHQSYHNKTEGNKSFSQIQQSEFSQTNISPVSKHRYVTTNNSIFFYSNINNNFKQPENFSAMNQDIQYSQSLNNLQQYIQDDPSSRRRANSHFNESLEKVYESVDNSRYYGFITLNNIYNYIDYIALLQRKQLELRLTEISIKRVINDVQKIVENQALKKKVKIVFINELRYDRVTSDERRIKQLLLNFLISILHKTKKGYIIIRASSRQKQLETIKLSIYNSGNYIYPIQQKAKFKLNSINDIQQAKNNKDCLEQAINSQIIGRLGPYDKVTVTNSEKQQGSTLSFQIYTDLNILNLPHKFQSIDEVDLQFQHAFKSLANIQQEGEISDSSSYDATYNMNKLQMDNFYQIQSKSFFPSYQFQDIATIQEKEDQTQQQLSSKKNYLILDIQNDRSNQNISFQESPLHPVTYNAIHQQYESSFQSNSIDQKQKIYKAQEEVNSGHYSNKLDFSKQNDYNNGESDNDDDDVSHCNEDNESYTDESGDQKNSNRNKKQKTQRNKNNESLYSPSNTNNRETKTLANSYSSSRNKQENLSKRAKNNQSNRQSADQRHIISIDQSKCYMINSATFDQNDENFSPRINIETTQHINSQQVLQPSPSVKNNTYKQIFFTDSYDPISRQKQNSSYEGLGYQNEEKNETKYTTNQFSSRQLNANPLINMNEENANTQQQQHHLLYSNQQQNSVNKQRASIIKLQQSTVNEELNKFSHINITSLKHIQ